MGTDCGVLLYGLGIFESLRIGIMNLKKFKLADLSPADYNPRKITPEALSGLGKSMSKFGYLQPIVVNVRDDKNTVISGHQRLKILLAEGGATADCVVVDFDSVTEKAANVALNSETISGDWELEGLETLLEELKVEFPEFEEVNLDELDIQFEMPGDMALDDDEPPPNDTQSKLCECPKCGFKWEK